ncbi:phosphoserine phosphatase SerB [Actinomadura verrucosospora]|uniref:phosphoserine phosphatase n=1 Tax=Actinomadura verrucosospora TaxID=46165 RepID=A0A7D3ZHQ8_ACTVE|nr:phosphoserine phosphatase SerB [Actinomadura verrucosospora]QKG19881.1 phosphoserine phosphatase SerB2 [Actinomadura verrucosospora]
MTAPLRRMTGAPAAHGGDGDEAGHRVTVCAPRVSVELLGAVLHRLAAESGTVTGVRTMASRPCTVLELTVRLLGPPERAESSVRASLRALTLGRRADIAVQRADRDHRLVAFDMDGTLIRGESLVRLAAATPHAEQVAAVTERALRGEVDFAEALHARARALAGLPATVLDRTAGELELTPGALVAVRTLQARGVRVGIVTAGFRRVAEPLARALGLDFCVANELETVDGRLTGRLAGDLVDGPAKAAAVRRLARRHRLPLNACAAVGDGVNDIDMLRIAGLGIAFTDRPRVVAAADAALSFGRLDLVLPLLGIPVPCTVLDHP